MDEKLNLDDINALIEALDSWEREDIQKIIKEGVSRAGISKDKESEKKADYKTNYNLQDKLLIEKRAKAARIRTKLLLLRKQIMKEV